MLQDRLTTRRSARRKNHEKPWSLEADDTAAPLPCSVEDIVNSVSHSLRMVDLDVMVEALDDDVLGVGHKLRERLLADHAVLEGEKVK